ncbi:sodium dependent transporter [Crocosphaera sp. UHCC 0190]|uniref:bile acid:sodium symporter family protein n=1 Tax=Crocosphaera sp. UHCC 0190 TaxID=3110246 RepID=UPI002B200889|nr:sodium dependent transporter [Crocosphaera sp. UHCC 0190]MEA5508527.1 sodium dependent transporter [Crocosphaera sp. UHCC 0190]
MNHPLLVIIVKVTIFSLMLAMGINLSLEKMLSLWRKPALLFRALLAVVVLVPLVVVALLKLFNLPLGVTIGLVLLAASPGAPLTTKRSQMAGARFRNSASLQLTLALLAVVITPLTLGIFAILFDNIPDKVTMLNVAKQVSIAQFLPISLGLLLQKFGAKYAVAIAQPLTFIANSLFLVLIILACIVGIPLLSKLWGLPLMAIAIMVIVSLGIGHALGGPDDDKRSILAISCIARNVGLALFIAILNGLEKQVMPTVVVYLMVGAVFGVLYSIYHKRKLAQLSQEN